MGQLPRNVSPNFHFNESKRRGMMFPMHELTAAPHFPHALRPLIAALTNPESEISLRVSPTNGTADIEVTESGGEVCVTINAGLIDG